MSSIGFSEELDRRMRRSLDLRTALILFIFSASLLIIGVVVHDAQHELASFSDIEDEQGHRDDAITLLQVAGSYRNIILTLWYLGTIGMVAAASFLGLAYIRPKKLLERKRV